MSKYDGANMTQAIVESLVLDFLDHIRGSIELTDEQKDSFLPDGWVAEDIYYVLADALLPEEE